LTGTPLTNTMAEIFTMQRYFQYDTLVNLGLSHFDAWAQMFADAVMMPEITPDGGGFRVNTRLARFTNIPELASMLAQFMIMRRWEQVSDEVERPLLYNNKPTPVKMPGSKLLKEFVKELAERAEDPDRLMCTHVSIKLVPSTLIRLVWMELVASALRLVGIKIAVFETRAGTLEVACLKYEGKHFLDATTETSTDESPYDCLSLGELINLGGYASAAVLDAYFAPISKDVKPYAVEVHAERFSMWFKIYFFGPILPMETNSFNLDILVKDFLTRGVLGIRPAHRAVNILE